jgi:hypothetical protein
MAMFDPLARQEQLYNIEKRSRLFFWAPSFATPLMFLCLQDPNGNRSKVP